MAINDKAKNDTTSQTTTQIANQSFDQTYQVNVVEVVTINPITGSLERPVAIQGNASLTISNADTTVDSTTTLTKTIGSTSYTKVISKNAGGDVVSVSAWSEV